MARNKTTSLKEIAYEVGLSINTVSRALRDLDDVAELTKQLVRQKALELGYIPNTVSQFLKHDDRFLIAIAAGSFDNPYFVIAIQKLIEQLNMHDYDFTLLVTMMEVTDVDLVKQCISQRADALISFLPFTDQALEVAKFNNLSLTVFGSDLSIKDVDAVFPDSQIGSNLAATYLVNYHRLDKLVYIGYESVAASAHRKKVFLNCVKELNSEASVLHIDVSEAQQKLPQLIREGYLGFYCFNDQAAYEMLAKLNEVLPNVRRIYPGLHIVGFDAISRYINGFQDITSISFDYELLAQKTVETITRRLENSGAEHIRVAIEPHLYQRKLK